MSRSYQDSDLDEQVKRYQPLVRRIAAQIGSRLPSNVLLDDLVQEGMTGLLDALQRYKPQADLSFERYASMRIRGSIYDACRRNDILPRHQRNRIDSVVGITRTLEQKLGRLPNDQEVAAEAGLSVEDYHSLLDSHVNLTPLDQVPEDLLPTVTDDDTIERISNSQILKKIVDALKRLPEKQQIVVALHYERQMSYREIAAVMRLTPGRISQLHTEAMIGLRALLEET
jgi:RNA polymerase sigma factor for flagellar operon FliA